MRNILVFIIFILLSACSINKEDDIPKPSNDNSICLYNYSAYTITSGNTNPYSSVDDISINGKEYDIRLEKENGTYCFENLEDGRYMVNIECWHYGQKVIDKALFVNLEGGMTYTINIL